MIATTTPTPARQCSRCGSALPAGSRSDRLYCSRTCTSLASAERKRRAAGVDSDHTSRVCEICSAAFETRRFNQLYCGPRCRGRALRRRRKAERPTIRRLPSRDEIEAKCWAIRAGWSDETAERRFREVVD